jgi:tyrosine-protein phosphatase SIW14
MFPPHLEDTLAPTRPGTFSFTHDFSGEIRSPALSNPGDPSPVLTCDASKMILRSLVVASASRVRLYRPEMHLAGISSALPSTHLVPKQPWEIGGIQCHDMGLTSRSKNLTSLIGRALISLIILSLPACANSSVRGIHNFYQVGTHVYRGAQPTPEGLQYLAKIGVRTVLDLRHHDERSSKEEQMVTALGMRYVNVPMTGLTPPTDAQISRILSLLDDGTAGAVFVHCRRGADRTGSVIAAYRISHDHWTNLRALAEAMSDGMSIFQIPRQHYILAFQPQTTLPADAARPQSPGRIGTTSAVTLPATASAH